MRWRSALLAFLLLAATASSAQLSQANRDYFDGPFGYLMTSEERRQWKEVRSNAAAEDFIALFWARRDPDLQTPENEFKADYEQRIAAADKLFAYGSTRGAMSARGRTLLLLGMCDKRYDLPSGSKRGQQVFQNFGPGGFVYDERGAVQLWEYASSRFPGEYTYESIYVVFTERNPNSNDFDFQQERRSNLYTFALLDQAPALTIKHPDLTEPPRPGLLPGSLAATATQLACFESAPRPWPAGAGLAVREGLFPGPHHFLWARLVLPEDLPPANLVVGRLAGGPEGTEAGSFAVRPVAQAGSGNAFELAVPVAPGSWRLDLAAVGQDGPMAVTSAELATTAVPVEGTTFGPLIWGAKLAAHDGATLGEPFVMAGLHVEARPDGVFEAQESLSYLGHVLSPVLDEAGNPGIQATLTIRRDGAQVVRSGPSPVKLSRLGEEVFLVGGKMPLARFTEPGDYVLTVELEQAADGARGQWEIPFTIAAATPVQ